MNKRIEKLTKRLKKQIERLLRKGEVNQKFLDFIRDFAEKEKQVQFWKIVLSRRDLSPINLYIISRAIAEEPLKTEARQKYVKIASDEDLLGTMRIEDSSFQEIIWPELSQRIQKYLKKHRTRKQAIEILKNVFEEIEKYRDRSWQILKFLGLSDDELQHLHDSPFMYSYPVLQAEIQALIKKRRLRWRREDYNTRKIADIQELIAKIAELKKGQ